MPSLGEELAKSFVKATEAYGKSVAEAARAMQNIGRAASAVPSINSTLQDPDADDAAWEWR